MNSSKSNMNNRSDNYNRNRNTEKGGYYRQKNKKKSFPQSRRYFNRSYDGPENSIINNEDKQNASQSNDCNEYKPGRGRGTMFSNKKRKRNGNYININDTYIQEKKNYNNNNNKGKKSSIQKTATELKVGNNDDNIPKNNRSSTEPSMNDFFSHNLGQSSKNLDANDNFVIFNKTASRAFKWLLHPVLPENFKTLYWEKLPLFVCRNKPDYYKDLNVDTNLIDSILRENHVLFGKNIDITTYTNGVRETHNPVGRAHAHIVWDFFKNGCSVRLLNPQTFINSVYRLNEVFQSVFNGFVGSNLYLTPPNSQGFAPHYDDIEAFVLQLKGCKYWRVYKPRTENEELPRFSSPNFTDDEVGEPVIECALRPGDLLYFPRGYIHQASTRDELSLHITLSAYQCNSFVDLLEKLIPEALSKAAKEDIEFRRGIPLNCSSQFGLAPLKRRKTERREEIKAKVLSLLNKLVDHIDIDSAVDKLVAKNIHDQLPPYFSEEEKNCMVFNNRTRLDNDVKNVNVVQLQLETSVCLVNPGIYRLVKEDDKYLLYYSINNSLEYHGNEEEYLEVPKESVTAFQMLSKTYPNFMKVKKLPIKGNEAKWSFATSLWEVGLLRTAVPITGIKQDFTNDQTELMEEGNEDNGSNDDSDEEVNVENEEEEGVEVGDNNEAEEDTFITVDSYSAADDPLIRHNEDDTSEYVEVCDGNIFKNNSNEAVKRRKPNETVDSITID